MSPKKKKTTKKKSAIIEPLHKDQNTGAFIDPAISVTEQPEFNRILFPLMDLFLILAEEIQKIDPELASVRLDQPSKKHVQALATAIDAAAIRIIQANPSIIIDIHDTLHGLRKRLVKSGDRQLLGEVETLIEFLGTEQSEEKIARSNLIRELALKHFYIFNEFTSTIEEQLGHTIDEVFFEGMGDDEKLDVIINDFENRYPGFIAMTLEVKDPIAEMSEEEFIEIFNAGMKSILNEKLVLNLFTKEEIEKGAELAEKFYKTLTPKEKQLIQNGSPHFQKSEMFRHEIEDFLNDILTAKRMEQLIGKLEKLSSQPDYRSFAVFFEIFISHLNYLDKKTAIASILIFVFAAEARIAFQKSTALPPLLFEYF